MRLQDHVELELKLTVVSDQPDTVLDQVARLDSIADLRLGPTQPHRLHDLYWDLPDGSLRARHLSLRLRQIDDRPVFTAKGGTSSDGGLFRRYELEVPATPENWIQLRQALVVEGAELRNGTDKLQGAPADWLTAAGLRITQDRATLRTVRYAYPGPGDDRPIAEVALDRTVFHFGEVTVPYWEIEIEQIDAEGSPLELGLWLVARFPDDLEFSTMGKYSRGLTIEPELRAAGRL